VSIEEEDVVDASGARVVLVVFRWDRERIHGFTSIEKTVFRSGKYTEKISFEKSFENEKSF